MTNLAEQRPELITALLRADAYAHEVNEIQLIETHISWVILTGPYAYKIKKPVNLGFLDFSTLDKRRHCCNEELRLNRRLAPSIYLDVVAITGTGDRPGFSVVGTAIDHTIDYTIEYAVRMRQFPQQMQLDHLLERGELGDRHMDAIAHMVADFHQCAAVVDDDSLYGRPETVFQPVEENFRQIRERISEPQYLERLAALEDNSRAAFEILKSLFAQRRQQGFVRECHGDMHLRNLVWYEDGPVAFDCIEFNPAFRWIDVMSEVAFLVMDLQDRHQHQLAQRLLNACLEQTGDYAGVRLLPFYCCYRAMVRAKVAAIRLSQPGISEGEKKETESEFSAYLELAESYTQQAEPMLIITRGMSASGKSTVSQKLAERLAAIRIRSDVERKRLHAVGFDENRHDHFGQGLYSPEATTRTYNRLVELAGLVLDSGYTVIIDAANLKHEQRVLFQQLATQKQRPYVIIDITASADSLRRRIVERQNDVSDADLSVLEHQLLHYRPLEESERAFAVTVDTGNRLDIDVLSARLKQS